MTNNKIALSGAQGFVGTKVCEKLIQEGYEIYSLVRRPSKNPHEIYYNYVTKEIEEEKLAQCFAVIHLAGKNIMSGLWTKQQKQELYDSRIKSSLFIAETIARLKPGPTILLNASATGIYGDQADSKLDEEAAFGKDFLACMCIDWERVTQVAALAHIRVVNMRFGIVLDKDGGMLKSFAQAFKIGFGTILGSGDIYMPYIYRDELARQILFVLKTSSIAGPVNMVAYEPTTNEAFSRALASALHRPLLFRIPSALFKLMGELGCMVITSARVYPKALLDHGFSFMPPRTIAEVMAKIYR